MVQLNKPPEFQGGAGELLCRVVTKSISIIARTVAWPLRLQHARSLTVTLARLSVCAYRRQPSSEDTSPAPRARQPTDVTISTFSRTAVPVLLLKSRRRLPVERDSPETRTLAERADTLVWFEKDFTMLTAHSHMHPLFGPKICVSPNSETYRRIQALPETREAVESVSFLLDIGEVELHASQSN
jgi:hypothetical protein